MICFVCHEQPDVEHEHHVTPQAAGGKHGQTVILCSNCHNAIHKEINRLLSLYRKGKGGSSSATWKTSRHSQEVMNATMIILHGLNEIINFSGDKTGRITISVTPELHQALKLMKNKLNARNLPEVVIQCIKYTIYHTNMV
jgi:hypothetical protein